jgi:protein SCO1/2
MASVETKIVDVSSTRGAASMAEPSVAAPRRRAALLGKPWLWAVAVTLLSLVLLGRALARAVRQPPALKLALPAFTLVNERGASFGSADLRGRIWVSDFVFTSCPTVCPKLTRRMAEIQDRTRDLGDSLQLVTFTVDPETDTPERLAAYAATYHADPRRWTFLSGPLSEIEPMVIKGFKQAMGKQETAPGLFSIFHGERLVLVDAEGMIRGYYEANDEGIGDLLRDIDALAAAR